MKIQGKLHVFGNAVTLRLTDDALSMLQFQSGDAVGIEIMKEGFNVRKAEKKKISELDLLSGMTAYLAHKDELAAMAKNELAY